MQQLLSYKQKRVLDNIRLYVTAKGQPPTLEELRENLGLKSVRTVVQYLEVLEEKGYIVRRKNAWRNIELRNADGGWGIYILCCCVVSSVCALIKMPNELLYLSGGYIALML